MKKHIPLYSTLSFLMLPLFLVGCSEKDPVTPDPGPTSTRIDIFANHMGGSKVLVDPADLDATSWVPSEQINLNGGAYTIASDANGFYLDLGASAPEGDLYAIYPATVKDGNGNDIAVTNNGTAGCAIDIHSLAVTLHNDGKHDVYFPMAAYAASGSTALYFDHLTGGLKLKLTNTTSTTVTRIVVTATQNDGSPAIYKDVKPSWASAQLPGLPGGEVGENDGDVSALFISDMTLIMNSQDGEGIITSGVTVPTGANGITFCIPMLAKELKTLTITGYNGDTQIFQKNKTLDAATNIIQNNMYNIPTIPIN